MSTLTKQAIHHEFGEMLKEKPFKQITVRDLTERTGINRNTFYYHYKDIYDLAEDYFRVRVQRIIDKYPVNGTQWIEGITSLLEFFQENKVIAMNMYNSMDYVVLEEVMFNALIDYSRVYIERKSAGRNMAEEDIRRISEFITFAVTGSIMRWAKDGMKGEPRAVIDRYVKLFGYTLNEIAANAADLIR